MLHETHWTVFFRPSWERGIYLQLSCYEILRYWAGIPNEQHQANRLCRRKRVGAAQRELSRSRGERFLTPGYGGVPCAD